MYILGNAFSRDMIGARCHEVPSPREGVVGGCFFLRLWWRWMAMMIACITLRNSISTNFSTCWFLLQDLAILVEDLASSRTRLMPSVLRLQPTPASVVQVEVLLEICSIIVIVAIIICFCICNILRPIRLMLS